jgi:hypothetical protein
MSLIMKRVLSVLVFVFVTMYGGAQTGNPCAEMLKKYNHSVVAKLLCLYAYDLSNVDCALQLKIADLVCQKDSLLVYTISSGGTIKSIKKDIETIENRINLLATGKMNSMAEMAAKTEVLSYKKAYNLTPTDSTMLVKFLYNKNRSLSRLFLFGNDTSNLSSEVLANIVYQKPVIDLLNKYQSYSYFNKQVRGLIEIKPMADSLLDKFRNRYNELLKLTASYSDKDRFEIAFKQSITDTAYYSRILRSQINDIATALNVADMRNILRYKPSRECVDSLSLIVSKKNYQLGLLAIANASDYKRREAVVKKEAVFYDSLIYAQLLKDGVFFTSGIINIAIKFRKLIKLRNTQVDSLIETAMYLNKAKDSAWEQDAFAPYDSKDFENTWLSRILDEDQLAHLLSMKYLKDAKKNAENDWADLEKRGLTNGLSRDTVTNELTFYYIKIKSASTMYAYDIEKNAAYSRSVREAAPACLRLLLYARKNNVHNMNPQQKIDPK